MRNYDELLPEVLQAIYPEPRDRAAAQAVLAQYGVESFHREQARVHIGILRLANSDAARLAQLTELACQDYRDLLCAAEYWLSSKRWNLRDTDPEEYARLQAQEESEYEEWLETLRGHDRQP